MHENNATKKEITLDDIARTLQDGLLKMDNGFAGVNKRLDKVETRLDSIEANLNKKVEKVDHNILSYRVEKLEKKFA